MKFYCMKCKKQVDTDKYSEAKTKNGKTMFRGVCPSCLCKLCRIGK